VLVVQQKAAQSVPKGQATAESRRDYEERQALYYRLHAEAEKAWDDEMARERASDCNEAITTVDINMCMGKRVQATRANYKRYTDAIRAWWRIPPRGADVDASGPTGTPPTAEEAIRRFDAAEATWGRYREEMCGLMEDTARGGTAAPYQGMACTLFLIRSHMRDIGATFGR